MTGLMTSAEYAKLPGEFSAQLISGCLIREPSPAIEHQRVTSRILAALVALVGPDHALPAPLDVEIDDWTVLQPDLLAFPGALPTDERKIGIPPLVFEVLSPRTRHRDRHVKVERYITAGVAEVWIVDPENRTLEIHLPDRIETYAHDEQARSRALPGLVLVPNRIFAPPA